MITAILSLLGSSAVGSLIGGMFAYLNRKADLQLKQFELAHEQNRWAHEQELRKTDLEIAKAEADAKVQVAVIETDAAIEGSRMQAIGQSQAGDRVSADEIMAAGKMGWLMVLVSVFNRLIRPVLTVMLACAALYVNWMMIDKLVTQWPALDANKQFEAGMQAFAWVTAQASVAFSYWFVARGSSGK
jgi:hypothetical protein